MTTRLLSRCPAAEQARYMEILEKKVAESPLGLSPGRCWYGPHNDTLLVFRDGELAAGLVIQTIAMLDPLILVEPLSARALLEIRDKAEGILTGLDFDEYWLCGSPEQQPEWIDLLLKDGTVEDLHAAGFHTFRRRI